MTINNRFEQIKQTVRVATNVVRPDKTADAGVSDLLILLKQALTKNRRFGLPVHRTDLRSLF